MAPKFKEFVPKGTAKSAVILSTFAPLSVNSAKNLARFFGLLGLRMTILVGSLFLTLAPKVFAVQTSGEKTPVNENTAASLEMIAERMKSLSGSLAAIPELPRLNQVIQIPEAFEEHDTETEKEIKK